MEHDVREVDALMAELSNWEKWGRDDERGTLNYITPAKVVEAGRLIRSGRVVSIAHDIATGPTQGDDEPEHMAIRRPTLQLSRNLGSLSDELGGVRAHGYTLTHIDALSHVGFEGQIWNDRQLDEVVTDDGVQFGDVMSMREGIVTRGVLLDVAASRGVEHLEVTDTVTRADLEAAEARSGTRVTPGDAVLVRAGVGVRVSTSFELENRIGLAPECARWLDEKEVSLFGSDCPEKLPSGYGPKYRIPFHQVVMVRLGLALLDNVAMEPLAVACSEEATNAFALIVAPLRIPHATGSVVNPLALF